MTKITDEIQEILRRGSFKDIKALTEREDLSDPDDFTKQNAFFYLALRIEPELQEDLDDICDFLRAKNLDPTQVDANGQTALYYACRDGNVKIIDFLLSCGVNVDHVDAANAQSALFFAARDGRVDAIQKLADGGAKIDFTDKHQQTPLFYAASNGRDEAVKLLVSLGADPTAKDLQRRTPSWFARSNNFMNTETLLKTLIPTKPPATRASRTTARVSKMQTIAAAESGALDLSLPPAPSSRVGRASSAVSRPSSVVMAPAVTSTRSKKDTERVPTGAPRYKCRIICRPVGSTRWLVADDGALDDLERMICPELAQWTRIPQEQSFEAEWSRKWQKEARMLLEEIVKFEPSVHFHKPVDIHKAKCLDYYDVIKIPMDFSKVRQYLKDNRYRKPEEFLNDIGLIFENCRRYNTAATEVAISGVKTEEQWELIARESSIHALKREGEEFYRRKDILYRARKGLWSPEEERTELEREREQRKLLGIPEPMDLLEEALPALTDAPAEDWQPTKRPPPEQEQEPLKAPLQAAEPSAPLQKEEDDADDEDIFASLPPPPSASIPAKESAFKPDQEATGPEEPVAEEHELTPPTVEVTPPEETLAPEAPVAEEETEAPAVSEAATPVAADSSAAPAAPANFALRSLMYDSSDEDSD